jgi:predicted transposase YbfD/YdcC
VFGEDKSRVRSRHGAANLTQVRKLALSLLKLESSRPGKSIVKKTQNRRLGA